jgi:hypothetical protein
MQEQLRAESESLERYWKLQVEKAEYEAMRAERQYSLTAWSRRIGWWAESWRDDGTNA